MQSKPVPRKKFADTGIEVSSVCLGTMMFGARTPADDSVRLMHRALDAGIDFWDTAPMYSDTTTEKIVGEALAGRRDRVFLATKVHKGVTYRDIVGSCDESLQRLRTDRIDLFQIHWPKERMNLDEITRALDDLVRAGKVRFVGCCNFPAWVVAKAREWSAVNHRARLVSVQPPYNLIERGIEIELLPMCHQEKLAVIPYRPLVMGLLSGKYKPGAPLPADARGQTDERIGRGLAKHGDAIGKLLQFAADQGTTSSAVALAWVRLHPAITSPIVGVSRTEQLEELVRNAAFEITPGQREQLSAWFDSEVKEEALGAFPAWRRRYDVLAD